MNHHKKKDSNMHLNKFSNSGNYLDNNNANQKQDGNTNNNYNSAKKYRNSPRGLYDASNNNIDIITSSKANYNTNSNISSVNNDFDYSIKAKRPFEDIMQTHTTPYSGVNTDNSEKLIKSNINKHGNYKSHKIESNSDNNRESFTPAARFYDSKSKLSI